MASDVLQIKAADFASPLALLSYLLEQDQVPISELLLYPVIEQYLDLMRDLDEVDMELASEFLLMAATLLQIKSLAMLPRRGDGPLEDVPEAFRDLELKLIAYRRCRLMADHLQGLHEQYGNSRLRVPTPPQELGIETQFISDELDRDKFAAAVLALSERNRNRFQDLRGNVRYLLQRERVSVRVKMAEIVEHLKKKTRLFFNDIFGSEKSTPERIAGFLALLELLHLNRITVRQDDLFAPISIKLMEEETDA